MFRGKRKYILAFSILLACITPIAILIIFSEPNCVNWNDSTPQAPLFPASTVIAQSPQALDLVVDASYAQVTEFYIDISSLCRDDLDGLTCNGDAEAPAMYQVFIHATSEPQGVTEYRMLLNYQICGEYPD